jgi:hypothetical protein
MDKLEDYIRKNRADLDWYTPPSGMWQRIYKGLKKQKLSVRQWISIAAMIIVIFCTAVILLKQGLVSPDHESERISEANNRHENNQINETEIYYNSLVNSLYQEAAPLLTSNPELKNELKSDISHLDSICLEIKKDLKDNVSNQEVIEALIQNYRIKLRLLEDMLVILKENDNKKEKNKGNEL